MTAKKENGTTGLKTRFGMEKLDLKKLPKTKKIQLAEAILEKERRLTENRIKYYQPTDKQKLFHLSKAPERWAFTGNRFGKTCMATAETVWHATGEYPEWYPKESRSPIPSRGRIVCVDFINGIEKIILPELQKWMPKAYLINGSWDDSYEKMKRKLTLSNGSFIELMSFDQEVGSFAGSSLHWVWFDEHGKREIYQENKMRLIDTSGRLWGTLTPIQGIDWEYDEIYEKRDLRNDLEIFKGSTMDNPFIGKKDIEEMTQNLNDDEKRTRLYGDFVFLTGLVYQEWNRSVHLIEPFEIPFNWTRYSAIDPHTRTPTAVIYWVVSPRNEHFIYDELYLPDMQVKRMAEYMFAKEAGGKIAKRLIDPAAKATNVVADGFNFINEFAKHNIFVTLADNRLTEGIQALKEFLKPEFSYVVNKPMPKLRIFNTCKNFIKEIEHYRWPDYNPNSQKDIREKPIKKDVHLPDCARYIAISNPEYIDMEKLKYLPREAVLE